MHKGSLGPKCADCHTDNNWKEAKFDHSKTRFALEGKHVDTKCGDCHKNKTDYKDAARTCVGCHRKDDDSNKGHKGQFGEKCESCHNAKAWKPSTFNHDVDTKYVLRGKHRNTKCTDCHSGNLYKVKTPQDCNSCHEKDDKHKGSLGKSAAPATPSATGRKRAVRPRQDQLPAAGQAHHDQVRRLPQDQGLQGSAQDCYGCHKKDDKREGTLGEKCESCHGEKDWKTTRGRFDPTRPVRAARRPAPKGALQRPPWDVKSYRKTPMECNACQKKDDKARGPAGAGLRQVPRRQGLEDHAALRPRPDALPAAGQALQVDCKDCHKSLRYKDAKIDCPSCHQRTTSTKTRLGTACEQCHNARSWKAWDFDHDKAHQVRARRQAQGPGLRGLPRAAGREGQGGDLDPVRRLPPKNDVHDGSYGRQCQQCHVTDSWRTIRSGMGRKVGAGPGPSTIPRSMWTPRLPRELDMNVRRWLAPGCSPSRRCCCPGRERAARRRRLRPPDHRLLADRQARGRALRDLPHQGHLQGHAEGTAPAACRATSAARWPSPPSTSRPRAPATPATAPRRSTPCCSHTPTSTRAAAPAATTT